MDLKEFLPLLEGVKGSGGQYTARCPAHDDKHASLCISQGADGRILVNCQAGCSFQQIVDALGVKPADLFPRKEKREIERIYRYPGGLEKVRYYGKGFTWRQPDGKGGWLYSRKGFPRRLYVCGELSGLVAVAEGEKDCETLYRLGYHAASGEDGAGPGKWRAEYTEQLKGLSVVIFQDNDAVGKAYAQETAAALYGTAASVKVLDLCSIWPEIPEHGDVSDLVGRFGAEQARRMIEKLRESTKFWEGKKDPFLSCFKTLDSFEEEEAEWLVPGWIPAGQVTLLAADGGTGKTSLWCNLLAALSNGTCSILDPPDFTRQPQRVAFLTTEDSVRKKLRKKLRTAGANMENIITPDFLMDKEGLLRGLKFGTEDMARFIEYFRPALCVFDPVQGFVPPDINMGSRNAMRDCTAPLVNLGEETDVTSLVVCHTNKRKGAWGRDRIADSADLWDVSRSVLMAGYTEEEGIRYLSNEKNNYGPLQTTVLFSIDEEGQVKAEGTSWKRDREFIQSDIANVSAPRKEDCKAWVLRELEGAGGELPTKDLEERAKAAGYAYKTLRRAKDDLKDAHQIRYHQQGGGKDKAWFVERVYPQGYIELSPDEPMPWDN